MVDVLTNFTVVQFHNAYVYQIITLYTLNINNVICSLCLNKTGKREELQDGRRVTCGDQLSPHKYIRNTSMCGTAPTEHLLNAGRRSQTSQKARNSPHTWVGQMKKEKNRGKEQGRDLHQWEGAMKEERFPHTRKPLCGQRLRVAEGGSFRAMEESGATRGAEGKAEKFPHRCQPALTSPRGLSAHPPGQAGLGAEARALEVGLRGEDWGWLREHSLKRASAPRLAGRESGEKVWTCRRGKRPLLRGTQGEGTPSTA